jgi:alkylation response protein AidB-like acyl-CoA dehydrogenase
LLLQGAAAEKLPGATPAAIATLWDRAAVLVAFEQLGGADACLDMARAYVLERRSFGRVVGSYQAVKHRLVDIYVANELARSNAYYAAWALAEDAPELPLAAAVARVSATEAYEFASRENIQLHGGIGFTWEADPHLHYRRSRLLALALGPLSHWQDKVVVALDQPQEHGDGF